MVQWQLQEQPEHGTGTPQSHGSVQVPPVVVVTTPEAPPPPVDPVAPPCPVAPPVAASPPVPVVELTTLSPHATQARARAPRRAARRADRDIVSHSLTGRARSASRAVRPLPVDIERTAITVPAVRRKSTSTPLRFLQITPLQPPMGRSSRSSRPSRADLAGVRPCPDMERRRGGGGRHERSSQRSPAPTQGAGTGSANRRRAAEARRRRTARGCRAHLGRSLARESGQEPWIRVICRLDGGERRRVYSSCGFVFWIYYLTAIDRLD